MVGNSAQVVVQMTPAVGLAAVVTTRDAIGHSRRSLHDRSWASE